MNELYAILSLCIGMAMLGFLSAELLYRGKLKEAAKWRDAVLDHLANACTDAPLAEHPRDTVQRIIDVHVAIALDPTINGGYKLVPIEPNAKMLAAGDGWCQFPRETWASMLHVVDPTSDALPLVDGVPTIDLDAVAWHDIKKAASESTWMPPEYMANDWQADVEDFLRNGPSFMSEWFVAEAWVHGGKMDEVKLERKHGGNQDAVLALSGKTVMLAEKKA